jgi:hypothetical protein
MWNAGRQFYLAALNCIGLKPKIILFSSEMFAVPDIKMFA